MNRPNKPRAYVALNKNELKKYDRVDGGDHGSFRNVVFLHDGDEFEIGLDNPTSDTYLAKIKLNGSYISDSGIVLRPGEHMFLERYLDEKKRFRFETYEIPKRNSGAVKENGFLEVEFYEERKYNNSFPEIIGSNRSPWNDWKKYDSPEPDWTIHTGSTEYSNTLDVNKTMSFSSGNLRSKGDKSNESMETGRVEKGGRSDQSFRRVNKSFRNVKSETTEIKILPESTKPHMKQDIKTYCTNCGKKLKDSWNNCPKCGEERI